MRRRAPHDVATEAPQDRGDELTVLVLADENADA